MFTVLCIPVNYLKTKSRPSYFLLQTVLLSILAFCFKKINY